MTSVYCGIVWPEHNMVNHIQPIKCMIHFVLAMILAVQELHWWPWWFIQITIIPLSYITHLGHHNIKVIYFQVGTPQYQGHIFPGWDTTISRLQMYIFPGWDTIISRLHISRLGHHNTRAIYSQVGCLSSSCSMERSHILYRKEYISCITCYIPCVRSTNYWLSPRLFLYMFVPSIYSCPLLFLYMFV